MKMVIACNQGKQRSVAFVELLKNVLLLEGLEVTAHHLHLYGGWGARPRLACRCITCCGQNRSEEALRAGKEAEDRMRQVFHAVAD